MVPYNLMGYNTEYGLCSHLQMVSPRLQPDKTCCDSPSLKIWHNLNSRLRTESMPVGICAKKGMILSAKDFGELPGIRVIIGVLAGVAFKCA